MKVTHLLLISLLIVGALFIPAASAYEETFTDSKITSKDYEFNRSGWGAQVTGGTFQLNFKNIENWPDLKVVYVRNKVGSPSSFTNLALAKSQDSIQHHVNFIVSGTSQNIGHGYLAYNIFYDVDDIPTSVQYWVEIEEWDITGLQGTKSIVLQLKDPNSPLKGFGYSYVKPVEPLTPDTITIGGTPPKADGGMSGYYIVNSEYNWVNKISITDNRLFLFRDGHYSKLTIQTGENIFQEASYDDRSIYINPPISWTVTNSLGTNFTGAYPTDTPSQTTSRTGSVTMTDHNGTTISGFEVTAVNHYTGEEYTVSTDTDVAVMELPMDRTIEIRNPQTGVYEEAPIGYYRFYGQKPGYKMLNEEGIKVSVLSEKYDSYKLCDILVSSDTGPLTGKHQFQLRSWSDNSILQTGTISAKSRTTGIWYNATVVNGLATLILPYDTSDAISEHAGHYYVYATSPGYEDIDYGVQIAVYPHTAYEVRSIHLYPIGGVPTPGNVTLRIQTISETGQSVANAEIFIAGVLGAGKDVWDTYNTSWTGFLEVSVPGNSTYDIVARAAGYYDSSRRIEVFTEDPPIIEMRLYLSGAPTIEPTTEPTGWVTGPPTTQPTGGIPDEDDGSGGFLMEAVRGISRAFGVGFATGKTIFGMLLALAIGFATAKQLRGGAAEFGMGLLGGTMLGILIGLIPVWTIVVLMLVVGLYIGYRYVGGSSNG